MGQRWLTGNGRVAPAGMQPGARAEAKWQAELRATGTGRAPRIYRECNPSDPDSCGDPMKYCDRVGQCHCRTDVKQGLGSGCASCPGSCGKHMSCVNGKCAAEFFDEDGKPAGKPPGPPPPGPTPVTGSGDGPWGVGDESWTPPKFPGVDEKIKGCQCCYWLWENVPKLYGPKGEPIKGWYRHCYPKGLGDCGDSDGACAKCAVGASTDGKVKGAYRIGC